jgi:ElaB/YqjD/DUF883 family membrane-anchored ribosome-binding protein
MDQTAPNTANSNTLRDEAGADRARLLGHLRVAVSDAEQWLSSAARDGTADIEYAKNEFKQTLHAAKADLLKLEDSMLARGKLAARATDAYVHSNPWQGIAAGAAIGLLAGWLIAAQQR